MKKTLISLASAALTIFAFSSCGSVSSVQPSSGSELQGGGSYDSLVVTTFRDTSAPDRYSGWTEEEQKEYRVAVKNCTEKMARMIISEAKSGDRFKHVGSKPGPGKNLKIDGEITRWDDGVASLRFWIGMGAGSSYLDGVAHFRDASSGRELGQVVIDKNSWALGGGIAATQDTGDYAEAAAEKIAKESLKFAR